MLDLLYQQVKIPNTANYTDAVIFVSMKIENLTTEGIKPISAAETIDELKSEIIAATEETYEVPFEDFNECKEYLEDQKILICIDNLETLLRESPEAFDDLNLDLPVNWRVIVTSRTLINANQIIRLDPLKAKPSEHLIRSYLSKKGATKLPQNQITEIAEGCYFNPLAIRLTLDRIITGATANKAIKSSKADIAEFSFRNLLESLSNKSLMVLEALFVCGPSNKAFLCDLLTLTQDELYDTLTQLLRTSLLHRTIGGSIEKYELSSSVKDLLLIHKSSISIREKIVKKHKRISVKAKAIDLRQKELSLSKFHRYYIPPNTDQNLKILVSELNRSGKGNISQYIALLKKFEVFKDNYNTHSLFHRSYAILYIGLKDYPTAINHAELALELNPEDPVNNAVLADCYFKNKDYAKSETIYKGMADKDWINPEVADLKFASSLCHGWFQSLLYDGRFDDLLSITSKWETSGEIKGLMAGYRASAYKRKVENSVDNNCGKYITFMTKSIETLDRLFNIDGYTRSPCFISWKILDEAAHSCTKRLKKQANLSFIQFCADFVSTHIINILQQTPDKIHEAKQIILAFRNLDFKNNPLKQDSWTPYITEAPGESLDLSEVEQAGYLLVTVYKKPQSAPTYVFARDIKGKEYYLHRDNCSSSAFDYWNTIEVDTKLAVIPGKEKKGKTTPVEDIVLVNI